ncbi:MAG TPA: hypothetical protein VGC88_12305 [Terriglobales bacterium]
MAVRNRIYARRHALAHVESYGESPVVVYQPNDGGTSHGNFLPASFQAIMGDERWRKRLDKVHTTARTALPQADRRWRETDSCMSSDALLMNLLCHPALPEQKSFWSMLGLENPALPDFGFRARVPLVSGGTDRTEVDARIGDLLIEAKLTESNFQFQSEDVLDRYRDFGEVFATDLLPRTPKGIAGYQLIRNVLAAYALQCRFCVLLDARRPDLIEQWYAVMRCVRDADMRTRCAVLTWQELTQVVPQELQTFLDEKYGIVAPGSQPSLLEPDDETATQPFAVLPEA